MNVFLYDEVYDRVMESVNISKKKGVLVCSFVCYYKVNVVESWSDKFSLNS